jgi:hypothetical protein
MDEALAVLYCKDNLYVNLGKSAGHRRGFGLWNVTNYFKV